MSTKANILKEPVTQENRTESSYRRKFNRLPILTKKQKKEKGAIAQDEARAVLKYARISPRKVNIVLQLIRNKKLDEVYGILKFTNKVATEILLKLIKSAEANAINNNGLDRDLLFISEAYANQGPVLKRVMPRAQGRAYKIKKRTSHIVVVLKEKQNNH